MKHVFVSALIAVGLLLLLSPEVFAALNTDSTKKTGWLGAQLKIHEVFTGIVPIIGAVTLAMGAGSMIMGFNKVIAGGIVGVGLLLSVGPGMLDTLSGTAIF